MVEYQTRKFYHKFLMDDLYLLSENSSGTGSVSSQGNVSGNIQIGEDNGELFAAALTFNTTTMADTGISKASIFLRRTALIGSNPISGNLQVKIKNGNFGTSADIEAADYAEVGDASGNPCLFGSNNGNGHWIRLDLPESVLPFITSNSTIQFHVSAPGFTGGKITFNDASDPEFAPVLNLVYDEGATSSANNFSKKDFALYPNPSSDIVRIEIPDEQIHYAEIFNMLGQSILKNEISDNTLNIASLPPGIFIINIATEKGMYSKRLMKN